MELSEDEKTDLAHSTHAGMLHDDERHSKYHEALRKVVRELKILKSEVHALDIGGGTGILSMMAADAGCDSVTACESCAPMACVAQKVITTNQYDDKVSIVCKSSHDVQVPEDMDRKADLLVTEIFDSELIGEGVLPTLRDAHARLLRNDARCIPCGAHVYIQLVESDLLWSTSNLKLEQFGIQFSSSMKECRGWAAGHEVQVDQLYPKHLNILSKDTLMTSFSFTEPFHHRKTVDGVKCSRVETTVTATSGGVLHGLVYWWDLVLHDDIVMSMKPCWLRGDDEETVWREHWMPALYYLTKPLQVEVDDQLLVTMFYDDYSVWFDLIVSPASHTTCLPEEDTICSTAERFVDRPLCSCGFHLTCPRERFSMLNDNEMHSYYTKMISHCLDLKVNEITVIGDMSILPLLLTRRGIQNVHYLECNPFARDTMTNLFRCNESVGGNIDVMNLNFNEMSASGLVLCEPYIASSLLPWQHLRVWKHIENVRLSNTSATILPMKATLKACTVHFHDLWKICEPVRNIGKFDLTDYDEVVASAVAPLHVENHGSFQAVEPHSMWEYKHELQSGIFVLQEFDLTEKPPTQHKSFKGVLENMGGDSNAVVLWMDYETMDGCNFCTGLNERQQWVFYSKQGVYFLPETIPSGASLEYNVLLDHDEFELLFSFSSSK